MQTKALAAADLKEFMERNGIRGKIHLLDVPTPTVELAAQALQVSPDAIVKSLLFLVDDLPVLVIARGTSLIDRSAVARVYGVGKKRVKLAPPEVVLTLTGYEVGAMPPFGHSQPLETLMDPAVLEQSPVYAGGGSENAMLEIEARSIPVFARAKVAEVQRRTQSEGREPSQS